MNIVGPTAMWDRGLPRSHRGRHARESILARPHECMSKTGNYFCADAKMSGFVAYGRADGREE